MLCRNSDLPPAVLASLLGVHIQTVNWASHTRRDWTTYIAERVKVSTPHQGIPHDPNKSGGTAAAGAH
jgi:hypothetical protein